MFGIYIPEKKSFYRPESGLEDVTLLRTVPGNLVGAKSYGQECDYHALQFKDGKRILVQETHPTMADTTAEFFHVRLDSAKKDGKKQDDKVVLILDKGLALGGFIVDTTDSSAEDRRDAYCTLEKALSV